MNERPPQPPEGRLLATALEASGLSIREASRRAGISYGRWRQVTSGVQNVSPGSYAAVRAPAKTVARMAAAVGLTPERLEAEGQRADAAEALRGMQHSPQPAPGPGPSPADPGGEDAALRRIGEDERLAPEVRIAMINLALKMRQRREEEEGGATRSALAFPASRDGAERGPDPGVRAGVGERLGECPHLPGQLAHLGRSLPRFRVERAGVPVQGCQPPVDERRPPAEQFDAAAALDDRPGYPQQVPPCGVRCPDCGRGRPSRDDDAPQERPDGSRGLRRPASFPGGFSAVSPCAHGSSLA